MPGKLAEGQKSADVQHFCIGLPPFYESSCSVKRQRTVAAPVSLPFFYPSIGVSLAPVGCFEVALAAPSPNEPKAQGGVELASTSTGLRSLVPFFPFEALENPPIVQDRQRQPIRRRVFSSHDRVGASTDYLRRRPRHFPACLGPANAGRISATTDHTAPGDGRLQSAPSATRGWRPGSNPRRLGAAHWKHSAGSVHKSAPTVCPCGNDQSDRSRPGSSRPSPGQCPAAVASAALPRRWWSAARVASPLRESGWPNAPVRPSVVPPASDLAR